LRACIAVTPGDLLLLPATLAHHLGLKELVERYLDLDDDRGQQVQLVAMDSCGADS